MRDCHEGDKWTVKLDVWDLGGHLDTTSRSRSATLASRVKVVISRLVLISVLPLDVHGGGGGGFGLFGLCLFLVLSMALRPLFLPSVVFVRRAPLYSGLSGLAVHVGQCRCGAQLAGWSSGVRSWALCCLVSVSYGSEVSCLPSV